MRDSKAASIAEIRFVVRINTPVYYPVVEEILKRMLNGESMIILLNLLDTSSLRSRLSFERASRKTSPSSTKRIKFQRAQRLNTL
jgi:hypothetical protein